MSGSPLSQECVALPSTLLHPKPAWKIIFWFSVTHYKASSIGRYLHISSPIMSYQINNKAIKDMKWWLFYWDSKGTAYTEHHFIKIGRFPLQASFTKCWRGLSWPPVWAKFPSQLAGGSGTSQGGPSCGWLQCFLPGQAMAIQSTGGWSLNGSKH